VIGGSLSFSAATITSTSHARFRYAVKDESRAQVQRMREFAAAFRLERRHLVILGFCKHVAENLGPECDLNHAPDVGRSHSAALAASLRVTRLVLTGVF
jgi:hypothetical protein